MRFVLDLRPRADLEISRSPSPAGIIPTVPRRLPERVHAPKVGERRRLGSVPTMCLSGKSLGWTSTRSTGATSLPANHWFPTPAETRPWTPRTRLRGSTSSVPRVGSEDAEHVEAALPRRPAEMEARGEDTLDPVACDNGVEDRPDSIICGDDGFDMGSEVMRGAGLDDLESRVVRPV